MLRHLHAKVGHRSPDFMVKMDVSQNQIRGNEKDFEEILDGKQNV